FMAVREIYEHVDVVVCHGGQGTVQSALAGAVPLVGFALQTEQRMNLDRAVELGAGIRIPAQHWHGPVIGDAIRAILRDGGYRAGARRAAALIEGSDGARAAATAMWSHLLHGMPATVGSR
ncbi:MAG: glycosyltransferase, partial [Actinocrinis sp.]